MNQYDQGWAYYRTLRRCHRASETSCAILCILIAYLFFWVALR